MKQPYFKILIVLCITLIYACADAKKETTPAKTEKTEKPTQKEEPVKPKEKVVENTKPAFGIDISFYQGNEIDDLEKSRDSIDFIICKATQGTGIVDPMFQHNWKVAKEKGFIRGAYHFYESVNNPIAQADFFIEQIKDIQPNDLPPVVDVEGGGIERGQSIDNIQLSVLTLLKTIEERLGVKPIIYTNIDFANQYLNNPELANYPLWIADYESQKAPVLPITWQEKGYVLWQKSDTYKIQGYTNDEDYFNGDLEALKTFIKESRL